MSISLDGYVAGPDQGPDDPVGAGGLRIEMKGGTTFHFVTDGFESALAQAVEVVPTPYATHLRYRVGY
jgi:hypothetical protein